jgi:hypothetical protein
MAGASVALTRYSYNRGAVTNRNPVAVVGESRLDHLFVGAGDSSILQISVALLPQVRRTRP